MTKFLAAIILLTSTAVQATPTVGDKSTFLKTQTDVRGHTTTQIFEMSLLDYCAETNQFTRRYVKNVDGQSIVEDKMVEENKMISDSEIKEYLEACEQRGGVHAMITVPAGTFDSCKLTGPSGAIIWVGKVPFGIVKAEIIAYDRSIKVELQSYTAGQQ